MTANDFQRACLRTEKGTDNGYPRIFNGVLGLCSEAGEAADVVKKHYFQGHAFDKRHILLELSDCLWYIAVAADALDCDLETVMQMNIDKLAKRYPEGFDSIRSSNRVEGDI